MSLGSEVAAEAVAQKQGCSEAMLLRSDVARKQLLGSSCLEAMLLGSDVARKRLLRSDVAQKAVARKQKLRR